MADRPAFQLWRAALAVVLLVGLTQAALLSWNRRFQVDEIEHIHATYDIESGKQIYSQFWEAHDPLLYATLIPFVRVDDPVGSFHRARIVAFLILLATILFAALAATKLGGPIAGAITAGALLFHSTMIERGIEVRPDGPLALATAAAFYVETTSLDRRRRFMIEALILSVAVLFTQKAAIVCFAFGCLWLWNAVRLRRPSLVLMPCVVWSLPVLAMLGWFAHAGNLSAYLRWNVNDNTASLTRHAIHRMTFGPIPSIVSESRRNLAFAIAVPLATLWLAIRRRHGFLLFLAAILFASLFVNPFPFPYLHITVIPTLATLVGVALSTVTANEALAAGFVVLSLLCSTARLTSKIADRATDQFAMLREIDRITQPDDAVFDLVGLHFRPDPYPIPVMTGPMLRRYQLGGFPPIPPFLRRNQMVAAMLNYRTGSLPAIDRAFLSSHTTQYDASLYVLGRTLSGTRAGESAEFEALKRKPFRFEGDGAIEIDGAPFTAGVLARGIHTIKAKADIANGRLILDTPPPHPVPSPQKELYVNFD